MKKSVKRIVNRVIRSLPEPLRDQWVRNQIRLPSELPPGLIFKVAEDTQELESAFRLVYESYLRLGYCEPNEEKMRATIYHALPTTSTLLAQDKDQTIGTLTVVRDNRLGLPLEKKFDLNVLRNNGNRLAEVTSLVIHKDYRRKNGGHVLFPLLKLMYEYSTSYFGVNHLVALVHPKEELFYKSLLLFEDVPNSGVKHYLGAPAIALHLDLQRAFKNFQNAYSHRPASSNLFDFFGYKELPGIQMPKRDFNKITDPLVSFSYFQNMFLRKLGVGIDDRRRIASIIRQKESLRFHPRVETEIHASVVIGKSENSDPSHVIVKDVSRNGFRVCFENRLQLKPSFEFHIKIANNRTSHLTAEVVWLSSTKGVGFKITKADELWHNYINYLYKESLSRSA